MMVTIQVTRGPSEPSGALPDATHVQYRPEQAWLGLIPGPCSLPKPQFLLLLQGTHLALHPWEPFTFLATALFSMGRPSFLLGGGEKSGRRAGLCGGLVWPHSGEGRAMPGSPPLPTSVCWRRQASVSGLV